MSVNPFTPMASYRCIQWLTEPRAARHVQLACQLHHTARLDVVEYRFAPPPLVQASSLHTFSDEPSQLLSGCRATPSRH